MRSANGYAVHRRGERLRPRHFPRRALRPTDVAVRIRYCGVCHSDLDAVRAHDDSSDPLVPGHEMVGEIIATGEEVSRFRIGDQVAIGNIVDSCGTCAACLASEENFCAEFPTLTYGGRDRHDGSSTQGGFSSEYVADQKFVHAVPDGLEPASVAPLLCAGITTYVALRRLAVGAGSTVGIVGLGGLGHLAVKFARAMGAHVVVFTRSERKAEDARALGADEVVISDDAERMGAQRNRFDSIFDTASGDHDLTPYLHAVGFDGTLCVLGMQERFEFDPLALLIGRKRLTAAGSGGTRETREMLEFCREHQITADVEVLAPNLVNEALDRLARGDVRYRLVLDMGGIPRSTS